MQKTLALLLVVLTSVLTLGAQAPPSDIPKLDIEKYTLRERARSDPLRGSSRAARRRRRLVSRRPRARSARPHGLRAPVRAHDVPGLEAHRERRALQAARRRRRDRRERHDRFRSHQLLRDDAVESARARALARIRSHGIPARDGRSGQADEPAGRRAERAAPEHREQTVRHRRGGAVPGVVSERASRTTASSSDRTPTFRPRSSTTSENFSGSTTRRTTRRLRSPATSTRRRPRSSSRNTSAR